MSLGPLDEIEIANKSTEMIQMNQPEAQLQLRYSVIKQPEK